MALKGIHISADPSDALRAIRQLRKEDAPFVTALALTKTGQDVKAAEYAAMLTVFDRPTKYALNSLRLDPATKRQLRAVVDYKQFGGTPAERYLGPQVQGGKRSHKSHEKALIQAGLMRSDEFVVPGKGVPLDASGNMRGATLTRILSQLKASRDPMQNMTAKSRKRAIRSAKGQFFVLRNAKAAPDGVYQRTSNEHIQPVLLFVPSPNYKARFHFYDIGQRVFAQNFAANARAAWQRVTAPRKKAA